jgi:choline monooxygenase
VSAGRDLVDPRVERASTLPSRLYTRPEALSRELDRVFSRSWQLVGHASRVIGAGDYFTAEIAGEPLLVARDPEGTLRALSNVCRHRAGPVAAGSGNRKAFRCGYHGWSYAPDGRLLAAPELEGIEGFRPESCRLPEWRLETWGPFLFANLDPAAPALRDWMPEIFARTGAMDLSALQLVERRDYLIACNWKVYVDNYLEGYHIPIVHPGLLRELDYDAYRTDTFENCSLQIAPIRAGAGPDRRYANPDGSAGDALYFWVFPNLMLNIYLDSLSTNLVVPLGHDRTLTVFEWYFRDPRRPRTKDLARRTIDFSDEIQQEDIGICEAVQRGLGSRSYDRGRFSPRRENGVHHFHRLLERFGAILQEGGRSLPNRVLSTDGA